MLILLAGLDRGTIETVHGAVGLRGLLENVFRCENIHDSDQWCGIRLSCSAQTRFHLLSYMIYEARLRS